jgi:hypothetical protein
MNPRDAVEILKCFDELPSDMLVQPRMAAILLGISERTLRRAPPIPKRQITARRSGYRFGDIRALTAGELRPA